MEAKVDDMYKLSDERRIMQGVVFTPHYHSNSSHRQETPVGMDLCSRVRLTCGERREMRNISTICVACSKCLMKRHKEVQNII